MAPESGTWFTFRIGHATNPHASSQREAGSPNFPEQRSLPMIQLNVNGKSHQHAGAPGPNGPAGFKRK